MYEFFTGSPRETEQLGEKIAKSLKPGVIALEGGLGMGKTCLVSGIAKGLGFDGEVSSPTFSLMNEYIGGRIPLYHFDMYRVEGWDDLYSTGFFDYLDSGGILAVEWSENIGAALPENTIYITMSMNGENGRKITISGEINFENSGA